MFMFYIFLTRWVKYSTVLPDNRPRNTSKSISQAFAGAGCPCISSLTVITVRNVVAAR